MGHAHESDHYHSDEHEHGDDHHHHHGHSHARPERRPGMSQALYVALVIGRLMLCPGDDILAAGMAIAAPLAHVSYTVEQEAVLPAPTYPVRLIDGVEVPIE